MNDQHDIDVDLIGRYVAGAASAAERRMVKQWIAADPARQEMVAQFEQVWRRTAALGDQWDADDKVDVDAKWRALREEIRPTRQLTFATPRVRGARRPWIYAAAAAIVLAVGAGVLWKANGGNAASRATAPIAMREYVTPRGQRAEFRLPDGTQVILSVDSRLRVPANYGVRDRNLYLTGEAYFDVQHNPSARFFVHTGAVVTEDLGTRFAVRAYPTDSTVQVVVAKGRVALRAAEREALLEAGQLGLASEAGEIVTRLGADIERHLAWTKGQLELKGMPLRDALPELGRWFDLEFRLSDTALASRRLTATFQHQPDDQLLSEVALTLGARVEREGRVVTFSQAHDRTN